MEFGRYSHTGPGQPEHHSAHQIQLLAAIIQEQRVVPPAHRLPAPAPERWQATCLLPCYRTPGGAHLYIITAAGRDLTSALLPEEYGT